MTRTTRLMMMMVIGNFIFGFFFWNQIGWLSSFWKIMRFFDFDSDVSKER